VRWARGRRLLLLSESAGLAAVLTRLLDRRDQVTRTGWSQQAKDQGELGRADLVVLDVPRDGRAAACQQLRRRYHGPVVVLVERGDDGRGLPADQARTLLARPFSTDELRAALGRPQLRGAEPPASPPTGSPDAADGPSRPAATRPSLPPARAAAPGATDAPAALAGKAATLVAPPAGTGGVVSMFPSAGDERPGRRAGAVLDGKAAAQQAPPRPSAPPPGTPPPGTPPPGTPPEAPRRRRLQPLLAGLAHSWRDRRTVRIAGFAGLAVVAFLAAFWLASQGRCGPGCDALTGIISPASTLPEVGSSGGPATTVKRLPPSTTTPTPGSGVGAGVPGGVLGSTTSTTARRATTTTRRSSPTSRPTTPTTGPTTTDSTTTTSATTTTETTVVP
jgi:hypothetical protein